MKIKHSYFFLLLCVFLLVGCKVKDPYDTGETAEQESSSQAKTELLAQSYTGSLGFINTDGDSVAGLTININNEGYVTNEQGVINYNLPYGNHRVAVVAQGFHPFVNTFKNLSNGQTNRFQLTTKTINQASLLFAGDTMFARRYIDPSLATMTANIPDVEGALIRPATAGENAQKITQFVAPLFQAADFASVNLETPVTGTPEQAHPTKEFSFFSLPETLLGITTIGIDYVALGNNHVYDFLEDGLEDTLIEVEAAGIAHSGAGKTIADSFKPKYMNAAAIQLGLFSATSITGKEHAISYVSEQDKGGAADLTEDELVSSALKDAVDNSDFAIAQMHGGDEYTYEPSSYIKNRFRFLSKQQPELLIAHHPHIAQGFATFNDVPAILGLGNFIFDQDRLETLLGVSVMVNVDKDAEQPIKQAFAYPVYVEGYQPRFTTGFLSDYLLRRLAEFSDDNITLVPRQGYADVFFNANQASTTQVSTNITIEAGEKIVDLRDYAPSSKAFLSKIERVSKNLEKQLELGRDVMIFGDFEDWDNDDEQLEVARWDHTSDSVTPCVDHARTGEQGLCSARTSFDNTPSIIPFRQTIRAMELPNDNGEIDVFKDFSLFGYSQRENAGKLDVRLVYTTAEDGLEFSTQFNDITAAGDGPWQAFNYDFSLPSDEQTLGSENLPPRGVKVTFRHFAPSDGSALLALDDIAMISWQKTLNFNANEVALKKMHGFDFLRVTSDSAVTYKLTFSTLN